MKEFAELGKTFGLKDKELQDFVQTQVKAAQDAARDERAAEKERREAELEYLAKKGELEALAVARKAEAEREAEQAALTAKRGIEIATLEEKRRVEQSELELLREKLDLENRAATQMIEAERRASSEKLQLQLELENLKLKRLEARGEHEPESGDDDAERVPKASRAPRPKMPVFNESKDDIDAYLQRFERFAELCKWEAQDWALHLSALLTGRALEVYARLPADEAKDFEKLKSALLRRYDMTEDGFRRKFHDARRDPDEGGAEYLSRTSRYLTRWIELAGIYETFERLKELLIKEQFLSTCEPGMSAHVRDKGRLSLEEVGKAADLYIETRRNMKASKTDINRKDRERDKGQPDTTNINKRFLTPNISQPQTGRTTAKCYVCEKPGHIAKDCRHRVVTSGTGKYSPTKPMAANACWIDDGTTKITADAKGDCSNKIDETLMGFAAVVKGRRNLMVLPGQMNDVPVKVMRDTGCTGVVVKRCLVKDEQFTGEQRRYRMLDGTEGIARMAELHLESPYFTGHVEALCIEKPLFDVIVGNVDGVKDAVNSKLPESVVEANAVVTRAQERKEAASFRGISTMDSMDLQVSREELIRAQKDDNSLKKSWEAEQQHDVIRYSKGSTATFEQIRGILHRMYVDESGKCMKQLVVPTELRSKLLSLAHDSILTGHLGMSKTSARILAQFYWPGLTADVARYCRSC